jgi:hypothetical protein
MSYSITTMLVIVNPETEQEEHIWIDAEVTNTPQTYENPADYDVEIISWGKCLDDSHPEWITNDMLFNALESVNLSSFDTSDNDDEYELRADK